MTAFLAHGRFCLSQHAYEVDGWPVDEPLAVNAPLLMAGLAVLSGWLDELSDDAAMSELVAAAQHGATLVDSGIVADAELAEACGGVLAALETRFGLAARESEGD